MGEPVPYDYREYWSNLHRAHRGSLAAVGYPDLGDGFNKAAYALRLEALHRLLKRLPLEKPVRVLEGAVGIGAYQPVWQAWAVEEWVGVEISAEAIADLRERFPAHTFVHGDLTRPDFLPTELAGARYDLATAIDVLYHLVDDAQFEAALTNVARAVRPGGYMILSEAFSVDPESGHVQRRPLDAYLAVLERLGFRLEFREPIFAILGDPVWTPGASRTAWLLFTMWRILAKSLRMTPAPLRSGLGYGLVTVLRPLDAFLRRLGVTRGINLELAAFRRLA